MIVTALATRRSFTGFAGKVPSSCLHELEEVEWRTQGRGQGHKKISMIRTKDTDASVFQKKRSSKIFFRRSQIKKGL